MTLCILNASRAAPLEDKWPAESHAQVLLLTVLCVQRATILFLRGKRSSQQLEAAEPRLRMKRLASSNSKAVNQIPSSKETQSEGVPQWKERKQGSRKWLLKRCILFNLAIRKLSSLNKRRVFLTYIDVPEFLLQVGVGKKGIKGDRKLDENYWILQKNIRAFIQWITAANIC